MRICKVMNADIIQQDFKEKCQLFVRIRKKDVEIFSKELQLFKNVKVIS